jgi:hypothetical protein
MIIAPTAFREQIVQIFGNDYNKSKLIQEELKRRLNSGIACYHSVQNICLLFYCLET